MLTFLALALSLPPQAPPVRQEIAQAPPVRTVGSCGDPFCPCGCAQGRPCQCKGIEWECLSYGEALAKGKPVMLYFTTSNCPPCARLSGQTFRDARVVAATRAFTVILADDATAKLFGVDRFPTVAIVHQGRVWKSVGYVDPDSLLRFFEEPFRPTIPMAIPLPTIHYSAISQGSYCGPRG